MKIAIIGTHGYPYVYGGYETFAKELSERLIAKGIDVTIYCWKNYFSNRPTEVNGIKLKYIPTIKNKFLAQPIHSFFALFNAALSDYDIVLVVNVANGPWGIFPRIFGKNAVLNVDGLEWERPKWKGIGSLYYKFAAKIAPFFYQYFITDSKAMSEIYSSKFAVESETISYGADIVESKSEEMITQVGLKKNEYYLVVGRLIPDNNADFIIDEFLSSPSQKKLVVVGDVPYKDTYAEKLKNLNNPRVLFPGYITDRNILNELYCNSFAYIHGHEFGGTNPTLLQALGCGCFIMSLDVVFNREVLQEGEYGLLFEKRAGCLRKMIERGEKEEEHVLEFRAKSRSRIKNKYNWERITSDYIALFNRILEKS